MKDQVTENQPANATNDPRQTSVGIEEAARPAQKEPAQKEPEGDPDDPNEALLHARKREEKEEREKENEELELGDREEVPSEHITAPAPPAGGDFTVTDEEQAQGAASADEERPQAAAEADQQRAEAAAWADDESHQQAAAQDEERFGRPAEEREPADETWLEDDAYVSDPDID